MLTDVIGAENGMTTSNANKHPGASIAEVPTLLATKAMIDTAWRHG